MAKTTTQAQIKDGRLVIMSRDARAPGVVTLPLESVNSGGFEIVQQATGNALVFKPAGKKTVDTIAVYDTPERAQAALDKVFAALSGGSGRSTSGFGRVFKIIGIVLVALIVLVFIADWFTGATTATAPIAGTAVGIPVGEPFPADDFINSTTDTQ